MLIYLQNVLQGDNSMYLITECHSHDGIYFEKNSLRKMEKYL